MSSMTAANNAALERLASQYQTTEKADEKDAMGKDAFLTMLVAQLKNQDPLNPMDGTEFTAQLAQFSQLESTMQSQKSLEEIKTLMQESASTDVESYIGKEVIAEVDAIEVAGGKAVGGFYTLKEGASVTVNIYDDKGSKVRSVLVGQQEPGSFPIEWDGLYADGKQVADGSYRFDVVAVNGSGVQAVETTVQGAVDGVIYSNGKTYLQVAGTFVDPDSLLKVWKPEEEETPVRPVELVGKDVTATQAVIDFDGEILGKTPGYTLNREDEVRIEIYDSAGKLVKAIQPGKMEADAFHEIGWDGTNEKNITVPPGQYRYRVLTRGATADTQVTGEATGLIWRNGMPYLNIDGALVEPGSVIAVSNPSA